MTGIKCVVAVLCLAGAVCKPWTWDLEWELISRFGLVVLAFWFAS